MSENFSLVLKIFISALLEAANVNDSTYQHV